MAILTLTKRKSNKLITGKDGAAAASNLKFVEYGSLMEPLITIDI